VFLRFGSVSTRVVVALSLTTVVTAVVTGAASASTPRIVVPAKGEAVELAGSGVECTWNTLDGGVHYVSCGLAGPKHRPVAGSYAATLRGDGRVDVVAARSGRTVFSRTTASAAPRAPLRVGDALHVAGTALVCSIVDADGAAAICFRSDRGGARPYSYGFAVGRRAVIVMAYDGKRRPRNAGVWGQPVR
jgi:hypothetical protein